MTMDKRLSWVQSQRETAVGRVGRPEELAHLVAFLASGKSSYVKARKVRNKRLGDACHWWAYVSLTRSPAARTYYDQRRSLGDSHNAALRNLANKLLGRLWWCMQNQQTWDDDAAWSARSQLEPKATAA